MSQSDSANIHPSAQIHSSAIIEDNVTIGENVTIGPWTIVGSGVTIGAGTKVASHVVINGNTQIGEENQIYQFSSIGEVCQDLKYKGEATKTIIGDRNLFRECTTVNRGTIQDNGETRIGDDNMFMAYVHVAHDCVLGNGNILANSANLAGHVVIGNGVIIGGLTGVTQFCHIGDYSMTTVGTSLVKDLPAFVMASGNIAKAVGLNTIGMQRRGYSKELMASLKKAYRLLYRSKLSLDEALSQMADLPKSDELDLFIQSIQNSERGVIRP